MGVEIGLHTLDQIVLKFLCDSCTECGHISFDFDAMNVNFLQGPLDLDVHFFENINWDSFGHVEFSSWFHLIRERITNDIVLFSHMFFQLWSFSWNVDIHEPFIVQICHPLLCFSFQVLWCFWI